MFTARQAKSSAPSSAAPQPQAQRDPADALRQLTARFDRLPDADETPPDRAYQLVAQIEQAAAALLPTLVRPVLSSKRRPDALAGTPLWEDVSDYLYALASGYRWCLASCWAEGAAARTPATLVTLIAVQAMRACAARLKWSYLDTASSADDGWRELIEIYVATREAGLASEEVALPNGTVRRSSVERELLKAVALDAGFPRGLTPEQIDIAEKLIVLCAAELAFARNASEPIHYFVDLTGRRPPQRLSRGAPMPSAGRGVVLSRAVPALKQIVEEMENGLLTGADLNLGNTFDVELTGATARHLLHHWDQLSRHRRHARRAETAPLTVVHGFSAVTAALIGVEPEEPVSAPEYWLARDRSETGFLAEVGESDGSWLQLGSLIAFRHPSDATWHAGIVRRLQRDGKARRQVGVEKLVTGSTRAKVRRCFGHNDAQGNEGATAMLLVDPAGPRESVSLLLPTGMFSPTTPLQMSAGEITYLLIPLELVDSAHGYQIGRFKLVKTAGL